MEYCTGLAGEALAGKRKIHLVGGLLAMLLVIGAAWDLPELGPADEDTFCESVDSHTGKASPLFGGELGFSKTRQVLKRAIGGVEIRVKSLEDSVRQFTGNTDILSAPKTLPGIEKPEGSIYFESVFPETAYSPGNLSAQEELPPLESPAVPEAPPLKAPVLPENSDKEGGTGKFPDDTLSGGTVDIVPVLPQETVPDLPGDEENSDQDAPNQDIPDKEDPSTAVIPGFQVDERGMLLSYDPAFGLADTGRLALPEEGITGIAKGAFEGTGSGIAELFIPSGVTVIEPGALSALTDLGWIEAAGDNPSYTTWEGVLYDKSMTTLTGFPAGRTGNYSVGSFTAVLGDYAFSCTQLRKLDMRECGPVLVGKLAFGEAGAEGLKIAAPREYLEEYRVAFEGMGVVVK